MALCACLLDEDSKASMRISQAIDRELSQFKKESAREFKLLLLGEIRRRAESEEQLRLKRSSMFGTRHGRVSCLSVSSVIKTLA